MSKQTTLNVPIQEFEKVEPWGWRCQCGETMQVASSATQTPLVDKETWRRMVAGAGYDYTMDFRPQFDQYGYFECWVLAYSCAACRRKSTDYEAQFTEEEARAVAARQNADTPTFPH